MTDYTLCSTLYSKNVHTEQERGMKITREKRVAIARCIGKVLAYAACDKKEDAREWLLNLLRELDELGVTI